MGHGTRRCIICGTDISDRHGIATRCRSCPRQPLQTVGQQTATCVECGSFFGDKIGRVPANRKYCGRVCSEKARVARIGVCRFDPCDKPAKTAGLCSAHAEQVRLGKELTPIKRKLPNGVREECTFEGCGNVGRGRGLCWGHREHLRRGYPLAPLRRRRPTSTHSARDDQGRKRCATCNEWKPTEDFSLHTGKGDGYCRECRECAKHRTRLRRFNLTPERHAELVRAQGGRCAICRTLPADGRELAVDHDHKCCPETNRSCGQCVRGLLCHRCNTGIGSLRDDPHLLSTAAEYLRRARSDDRTVGRVGAPLVLAP